MQTIHLIDGFHAKKNKLALNEGFIMLLVNNNNIRQQLDLVVGMV